MYVKYKTTLVKNITSYFIELFILQKTSTKKTEKTLTRIKKHLKSTEIRITLSEFRNIKSLFLSSFKVSYLLYYMSFRI